MVGVGKSDFSLSVFGCRCMAAWLVLCIYTVNEVHLGIDLQNTKEDINFVERGLLIQGLYDKTSHTSQKNAELSILSISSDDIGLLSLWRSGGGRQRKG